MSANRYLPRAVPHNLQGLIELALDLRWSWYHGTDRLWRSMDAQLWEASGNPWLILQSVSDKRLQELAAEPVFAAELQRQLAERAAHLAGDTWFAARCGADWSGCIAYFSLEFGVSESLPIYSGGLGILAGDYLKTACDLGVPLVGVGLLYQQGYFRQAIDARGEQIEFHPYNDPGLLPVTPLRNADGEWLCVEVDLPGRALRLRGWHAQVGRRELLLLDSNDPRNDAGDRGITSELYGGGAELRLQQEIVLGIGGWRLLQKLGRECPVCHLNEGHAAFVILERARDYAAQHGVTFQAALRATRAGNLFTSHTPVTSGFDRFAPELFAHYFRDYAQQLDVDIDDLLALGRIDARTAGEPFITACLAVRGSGAVNGVSRLHGEVSRGLLQPLFPRWPRSEVPVSYVTNGVHMPSWDSAAADTLWTDACGKERWRGALDAVGDALCRPDDTQLWDQRAAGRRALIDFVRARSAKLNRATRDSAATAAALLEPDILTLGLARRFAEYKRPNLLLRDPQRLLRLLLDRDRPVQLIIAGKAHPRDVEGKRLLRQWHEFLQQPALRKRAIFIEDYDMNVAAHLVQGVDVWLNTPRRPWEACGTSGMKVLVNGGLNLSELDGWWAEAYVPEVGWALGDGCEHSDSAVCDAAEALQLYRLLEQEVVPCFYRRDQRGLPREWIARMRASMAQLAPQYSSNRMLREYTERYYLPLAAAFAQRDGSDAAATLEQWHTQLARHWRALYFGNVSWTTAAQLHRFEVQVYLDEMPPDAVAVQLYAEADGSGAPACLTLTRGAALRGGANAFTYSGEVSAARPATDYTPRIVARHALASVPLEANFILWYR